MELYQDHFTLSVFDYRNNKLCDLYDSKAKLNGQAFNIEQTTELGGWKSLQFKLPYMVDKKKNFRWNFIRSEYLLRYTKNDFVDWYIIHSPQKTSDRKKRETTVNCSHISAILKTKNLYLYYDDENGIGTIAELLSRAVKGTGWDLGLMDVFYERDGTTEKIRTYRTDGKLGAYQVIVDICNLFNAYPVFNGDSKTIDIRSLNNKKPVREMTVKKNIESISVTYNSENIITRLYVEGEYTQYGNYSYVGIESVNPTGLNFLLNFDYYKEIGVFTDWHEEQLQKYLIDMKNINTQLIAKGEEIQKTQTALNELWGQISYVYYLIENSQIARPILGGAATVEQVDIVEGNSLVIGNNLEYREVVAGPGGSYTLLPTDTYMIKFITLPAGIIGGKQVGVEAKVKLIAELQRQLATVIDPVKREEIQKLIDEYEADIVNIFIGTEESDGLYTLMAKASSLVLYANQIGKEQQDLLTVLDNIEADFAIAMGDMLKDGYWSDTNYVEGQEESLYLDGLDVIEEMSKPSINYNISLISLADLLPYKNEVITTEINTVFRVYDEYLGINDFVFVNTITECPDKRQNDTLTVSNEDITIAGKSFDSILGRITRLADLIDQKNSLYERAEYINKDGTIYADRLQGQIDLTRTQILSSMSNWYTDENGNMVFESLDGRSAMMITGSGFMLANGKDTDGNWNWRTFGTGNGFTADEITAGFISAERIEAGSITTNKLASEVGSQLDLSSNTSIRSVVQNQIKENIFTGPRPPANPIADMLWMDTSFTPASLKRWNGSDWEDFNTSEGEFEKVYGVMSDDRSEVLQLAGQLVSTVTKTQLAETLNGYVDQNALTEQLESVISQTATDIEFSISSVRDKVIDTADGLAKYQEEVRTYMRFTQDGLELGKDNSPFIATFTPTKLSFLENGTEIAYFSNNNMFITNARITSQLSIGTEGNGWYDFATVPGGLTLIWRE